MFAALIQVRPLSRERTNYLNSKRVTGIEPVSRPWQGQTLRWVSGRSKIKSPPAFRTCSGNGAGRAKKEPRTGLPSAAVILFSVALNITGEW